MEPGQQRHPRGEELIERAVRRAGPFGYIGHRETLEPGRFLKVGLRVSGRAEGLAEYHADIAGPAGARPEVLVADAFDPMLTLIASGDGASALAGEPLEARRAYAAERVAALLGADWAGDPYAGGS
jgi:hypothetical protein